MRFIGFNSEASLMCVCLCSNNFLTDLCTKLKQSDVNYMHFECAKMHEMVSQSLKFAL